MCKRMICIIPLFIFILSGCNTEKNFYNSIEEALTQFIDGETVSLLYQNEKDQTAVFKYENYLMMAFFKKEEGKYKFEEGNGDTAVYTNRADPFQYHYFTHPETNQFYVYGIVRKPKNAEKVTLTYNYDHENEQLSEQKEADINEHNIFVIPINKDLMKINNISYQLYNANGEMIKEIARK